MFFYQLFLKEIILIIKRATLQAGLRGIISQFIHSHSQIPLGLRESMASQGTLSVAPRQVLVPLGGDQTNQINIKQLLNLSRYMMVLVSSSP